MITHPPTNSVPRSGGVREGFAPAGPRRRRARVRRRGSERGHGATAARRRWQRRYRCLRRAKPGPERSGGTRPHPALPSQAPAPIDHDPYDGETMSKATQPPAPHAGDRHDLIRVQGARVNNLKDVSVEIPKRRLTVFTGVSGSGKSSLVFGTIAAESQRLINETYSAFVQGFMPTLTRPEVDVLDGLTTAIIVDQERMGAN